MKLFHALAATALILPTAAIAQTAPAGTDHSEHAKKDKKKKDRGTEAADPAAATTPADPAGTAYPSTPAADPATPAPTADPAAPQEVPSTPPQG